MNPSQGLQTALNEIRNTLVQDNSLYQTQIPLVDDYTSSQVYFDDLHKIKPLPPPTGGQGSGFAILYINKRKSKIAYLLAGILTLASSASLAPNSGLKSKVAK